MVHLEERASEEASVVSSNVSRKSKASHNSGKDPISAKAKAAAAQAYVRKQKEIAKEKRCSIYRMQLLVEQRRQ